MLDTTVDCKIPSELVPVCPVCGGEMDINLRKDQYFVQDENWYNAAKRYEDFLHAADGNSMVFLELGVGYNTPGIIRYPFEQMTYHRKDASLIRLNKEHPEGAKENKDCTIAFTEDMQKVVSAIMR